MDPLVLAAVVAHLDRAVRDARVAEVRDDGPFRLRLVLEGPEPDRFRARCDLDFVYHDSAPRRAGEATNEIKRLVAVRTVGEVQHLNSQNVCLHRFSSLG